MGRRCSCHSRPFLVTVTSLTHLVRPRSCLDRPLRFDERDMTEKANCAPHGRRAGPADDADGDGPTPKLEQGHTPLVSSDSGRGRSPRGRREGAGASSAAGQRGNHFRLIECTLSCCSPSPRNLRCRWTDARDGSESLRKRQRSAHSFPSFLMLIFYRIPHSRCC